MRASDTHKTERVQSENIMISCSDCITSAPLKPELKSLGGVSHRFSCSRQATASFITAPAARSPVHTGGAAQVIT